MMTDANRTGTDPDPDPDPSAWYLAYKSEALAALREAQLAVGTEDWIAYDAALRRAHEAIVVVRRRRVNEAHRTRAGK
jgi:hypothetical protein